MNQQYGQQGFNIKKTRFWIAIAVVILFVIIFGNSMFVILQPTERGVIFYKFSSGLDVKHIYSEGFHIIAPWNDMIVFSVEEQQVEQSMDVLSSNGLSISVDVTIRFRPIYDQIGYLYKAFRTTYIDALVIPELRSAVRKIIGRYTPEELYSTKREEIETSIKQETSKILSKNHVQMTALLIRSVRLPQSIQTAIEKKLEQEQASLEYEFKLQKEQKEADRKRIEAQGIQDFQRIISQTITPSLLKWKGIEATLELSKSENAKVVVIGGDDGLPIILGNQ